MKALLAILSLPLLLVLSSCGDSDDPTRGIKEGSQVIYQYAKGTAAYDSVSGVIGSGSTSYWLVSKTDQTVTVRSDSAFSRGDSVEAKSDIDWMEKVKDSKPMPRKAVE